ncbi:MAG: hypothetical protein ACQEVA_20805 [Myxococcota bacterium]
MILLKRIAAACMLLSCLGVPTTAPAQCPQPSEDLPSEDFTWRGRLAAWVPDITFELSSKLARKSADQRRMHPEKQTQMRLGPAASARWRDESSRRLDWQVAAHWDVVELVESLSPLPEHKSDRHTECDEQISRPAYLAIEEDT